MMESQEGQVCTNKANMESNGKSFSEKQVHEIQQKEIDKNEKMIVWLKNVYDELRSQQPPGRPTSPTTSMPMMESSEGISTNKNKLDAKLDEQETRISWLKNEIEELLLYQRHGTNDSSTDEGQHQSLSIHSATVDLDGTVDSLAIPATTLDLLAEARKSVGCIHCGNVTGTCFLLTGDAIITCKHVIDQILAATDPERYQKIEVNFDYDYPGQLGRLQAEIDEERREISGQHDLDYVICFLKPNPALSALRPLGPLVRTRLPQNRRVALMGHPESQSKLLEICQIIPDHEWHATLGKRKSEADKYCQQNPQECPFLSGHNVPCKHQEDILKDDHSNDVPYDTSFLNGSSGSPVFNADGHIVAMHRMGYPYFRRSTKFSLMEFGITFSAIYRDLKMQLGEENANRFLPGCQD